MKVLVFTTLYPNNIWPNHGVFIKERMSRFAKLDGCEVRVIAPVPYFPPIKLNWRWRFSQVARREVRNDIVVYHPRYVMIPRIGMALYGWMMFLSVLRVVREVKKEFVFDLIDAHYVYPDGFAAVLLGALFKKPVVVSARGSDINLLRTFPVIRKLLQYVLRKADRVVAVSNALKEAMVQLGVPQGKVSTIPNGVDTEQFYRLPQQQARRELGLPNRKTVLSVGNLTANKGFDLVIKSLRILADKFHEEDVHLAIVGDGPCRNQLEKLISWLKLDDQVLLVGAVPHEKLYLWYSAADVFCLASHSEGRPNVILESLACGTAVVATQVGGIPEIIDSVDLGLLTARDELEIAKTIRQSLKKTWHAEQIVDYAKHYSWECTVLAVYQIFKSVFDGKPANIDASLKDMRKRVCAAQNHENSAPS